jgi:hypothetical protein
MILVISLFILFITLFYKVLILIFNYKLLFIVKGIILSLCMYLLYFIQTYPTRQRRILSKLRKWRYRFPNNYKLKTREDHIINITILLTYVLIFILGFLWLRFRNSERSIDLVIYYDILCKVIMITPLHHTIINLLLLVCIFLLYIKLLTLLTKYFKLQFIKRHIYLSNPLNTHLPSYYYMEFIDRYYYRYMHLTSIINKLHTLISYIFHYLKLKEYPPDCNESLSFKIAVYKIPLEDSIYKYLSKIKYILHYLILFIIMFYDIVFNSLVLTHMFKIMPYMFIYELLVRLSKVYDGLNTMHDLVIHDFLYASIQQITKDEYQVGSFNLTKEDLNNIITNYVYTDLVDIKKIVKENNVKLSNIEYIINVIYKIQTNPYIMIYIILVVYILYSTSPTSRSLDILYNIVDNENPFSGLGL